ncbi:MAG: DUF3089 domain-containing protein [Ruminococcaceae bacterium]|nr:DUF3089 domain-containing protein [Oscillospiraceae bacterium]
MKKIATIILSLVMSLPLLITGCQQEMPKSNVNYSDANNWAYCEKDNKETKADVFFICPTVYKGDENSFNMSLSDEEAKKAFIGAANMEKGIYDENARFFAPFYSQAGLNAYTLTAEDRDRYLLYAYEDIRSAFIYYLDNYNEGRSIVLAGFSQGADMCIRLMKEFFTDEKLQDQLVACYAIGWAITEEELTQYPHLKFATNKADTGVIISFNCEAENVTNSLLVPEGVKALAINPLNWRTNSEKADKEKNIGACFTNYDGNINSEIPNLTGAYIDSKRGTLKITDVTAEDYPAGLDIFEDGVFHLYDYQFFYRNLQENVSYRIERHLSGEPSISIGENTNIGVGEKTA